MTTIRFQEIKQTAKRRIDCAGGCGKRLTRQRTFTQTVNPFNRNQDGHPKSIPEIREELRATAAKWEPTAYCAACDDG